MEELERQGVIDNEGLLRVLQNLEQEPPDLDRLKEMLPDYRSEADIFRVLGLDGREEFHSNFLAWLLNPRGSHGLEGFFLQRFLLQSRLGRGAIKADAISSTEVSRERHLELNGYQGRLDIQIRNDTVQFLCVIENKVWSAEGDGQLSFYRQALAKEFPKYRLHHIFLTPLGASPDEQEEKGQWTTISYSDILKVVDDTIEEKGKSINTSVKAFLSQYAITLRRNIVSEVSNDVQQLARRIYRKHQEAIDLIAQNRELYKPNYVTEGIRMFRKAINDRPDLWKPGTTNRPYVRFTPVDWEGYEFLKLTAWPHAPLLFEIHVQPRSSELYLILFKVGAEPFRKKIYEHVMGNPGVFNCGNLNYDDPYLTFFTAGSLLKEADYENQWDEDATQTLIHRRLDDFAQGSLPSLNKSIMECLEEYQSDLQ